MLLLNLKFAQHTVRDYILYRSIGMSDMRIIMSGGAGQGSTSFFGNVADLGLAMAVVWGIVWGSACRESGKEKTCPNFSDYLLCVVFSGDPALWISRSGRRSSGNCGRSSGQIAEEDRSCSAGCSFSFWGSGLSCQTASKERFSSAWIGRMMRMRPVESCSGKPDLRMFEENPVFGVGPGNFILR